MSNLQLFEFNSQSVRIISVNGDPWFVAKDVCEILEIGNVSKACNPLKDREKNTITLSDGIAGNPTTLIIIKSLSIHLTIALHKL